jgi:hypothetical protein
MNDIPEFRAYLRRLSPERLAQLVGQIGGPRKEPEQLIRWADSPENERILCNAIKQHLGDDVLTTAERQDYLSRITAEATARQAAAAVEGNQIAYQANEIAVHANATAKKALRVSWWNTAGTIVATLIAVGALIISLWK